MEAFFAGNSIDAFIGPPTHELSMGNVVGLPEAVIPVSFSPVALASPRQQPTTVGIYAPASQDGKVRAAPIIGTIQLPPTHSKEEGQASCQTCLPSACLKLVM